MTTVVEDYGWRDAGASCAHGYIQPAVLDVLAAAGCRSVLDLGCGNGALTHVLRQRGFEAVGCDADAKGVELARRGGGRFEQLGVYDDPALLGSTEFDAVVSVEVIEHLMLPGCLPRFAWRVLRPGGLFVVTTPYHGYLKNLALSIAGAWDGHFHPLRDGGHVKFFSRATLEELVAGEGFRIEGFRGVGRLPWLWKSMIVVARKPEEAAAG